MLQRVAACVLPCGSVCVAARVAARTNLSFRRCIVCAGKKVWVWVCVCVCCVWGGKGGEEEGTLLDSFAKEFGKKIELLCVCECGEMQCACLCVRVCV